MKHLYLKKLLPLLAALLLLPMLALSPSAETASGTCGVNLKWSLSDDYVLTVTGSGKMSSYDDFSDVPWSSYSESITAVVLPEGLESIGDKAFFKAKKLTSVALPDSVTSIGERAFGECTELEEVNLPSSLTSIGKRAFENCVSLKTVLLPATLETLGLGAFNGCTALKELQVAMSHPSLISQNGVLLSRDQTVLHVYPAGKADTRYAIPQSVTRIDDYAFSGNTMLSSVYIPAGVTATGENSFTGLRNLILVYYGGTGAEWNTLNPAGLATVDKSFEHQHDSAMTCSVICHCGANAEHAFHYHYNYDATCLEDGTKSATCSNGCGAADTQTAFGTAGHLWRDGVCPICGEVCAHSTVANSLCVACDKRFPAVFEIRGTDLFVSYDNEVTWISLGTVVGQDGKDGKDGQNGANGLNGENGRNGITARFRINSENMWEVSYDEKTTWIPTGVSATGAAGEKGVTPSLRIHPETNMWEVSYDNGQSWISMGITATGADGKDGSDGSDGTDGSDGKNGSANGVAITAIVLAGVAILGSCALLGWHLYERRTRVMVFREPAPSITNDSSESDE